MSSILGDPRRFHTVSNLLAAPWYSTLSFDLFAGSRRLLFSISSFSFLLEPRMAPATRRGYKQRNDVIRVNFMVGITWKSREAKIIYVFFSERDVRRKQQKCEGWSRMGRAFPILSDIIYWSETNSEDGFAVSFSSNIKFAFPSVLTTPACGEYKIARY